MSEPWEDYAPSKQEEGPWTEYAPKMADSPTEQAPSTEPGYLGMAGQAVGHALKTDVPYLAPAVQYMRDLPFQAQEKMTEAGYPKIGTALGMASMPSAIAAEFLPKTGGQLALQGLIGPTLKAAGMVAKKVGPSIVSTIDQIAPPIAKRAFERTEQVYSKLKTAANTEVIPETIRAIKESIKLARKSVGERLGLIEDEIAAQMPGRSIATHDLGQKLEQNLASKGFDISGQTGDVSRRLSGTVKEIVDDFKNIQGAQPSTAGKILGPEGQATITPAIPGVSQPMSFKDALTLRRKIDDAVDYVGQESMKVGKQEEAILKTIRRELNERLKDIDYRFRDANDTAAETFENYRKLASDVMSGSEDTIQKKITNLFSKDTIERRAVEYMDESFTRASRKLDDVLDMITASKFSAKLNPSLERAFMHTGGGPAARAMQLGTAAALGGEAVAHGVTGPAVAGLTGAMAVTSPRLGIEAIYRGRQAYEALARPGVLPTLVSPAMLGEFQRLYDKLRTNKYGAR